MQTMYKRKVEIYSGDVCIDVVVRNVVKQSYKNRNGLVRYQKLWRTAVPSLGDLPDNHKGKTWIVVLDS